MTVQPAPARVDEPHRTTRQPAVKTSADPAICIEACARARPPGHQTALTRDLRDRESSVRAFGSADRESFPAHRRAGMCVLTGGPGNVLVGTLCTPAIGADRHFCISRLRLGNRVLRRLPVSEQGSEMRRVVDVLFTGEQAIACVNRSSTSSSLSARSHHPDQAYAFEAPKITRPFSSSNRTQSCV